MYSVLDRPAACGKHSLLAAGASVLSSYPNPSCSLLLLLLLLVLLLVLMQSADLTRLWQ
jgi:hypothetical protein